MLVTTTTTTNTKGIQPSFPPVGLTGLSPSRTGRMIVSEEDTDYIGSLRGGGLPDAEPDASYEEEEVDKEEDKEASGIEVGGRNIGTPCPYPSPPTPEEKGRRSGAPIPSPARCSYPSPPEQRGRRSGAPSPSPPGSSSNSSSGSSSSDSSEEEEEDSEEEVSAEEIAADMRERVRRSRAPSPSPTRFPSRALDAGSVHNPIND
ncbi:hypothetical protein N0V85_005190 [Neurospora sp. IMI 360204]|nr:hypothetical protein N0V85_005190 [Neurospora sp. IMI 360204]